MRDKGWEEIKEELRKEDNISDGRMEYCFCIREGLETEYGGCRE